MSTCLSDCFVFSPYGAAGAERVSANLGAARPTVSLPRATKMVARCATLAPTGRDRCAGSYPRATKMVARCATLAPTGRDRCATLAPTGRDRCATGWRAVNFYVLLLLTANHCQLFYLYEFSR